MNEMVERVADALNGAYCGEVNDDVYPIPESVAREMARAAIEAMREPPLGILSAGFDAPTTYTAWQAIIDEALK